MERKFFKVLRRSTIQMLEIKTSDISFEDKLRKWSWNRTRLVAYIDLGFYIGLITLNTYKILFRNIMKLNLIE